MSLLLSGGIGSFATKFVPDNKTGTAAAYCLIILMIALAVVGALTPSIIKSCCSLEISMRVLVTIVITFLPGVLMGMPFPLAMKVATGRCPQITPWLWSANGAMSVVGSVFAIILAIYVGISVAFAVGVVSYLCAFAALYWAQSAKTVMPSQPAAKPI
jgi:predicted membrane-bound spermidine synthase